MYNIILKYLRIYSLNVIEINLILLLLLKNDLYNKKLIS
jgi:hypothetical protein